MQNIEGGGRVSQLREKIISRHKRILVFSRAGFIPLLVRKRFRDMLVSFSSGGRTGSYEFSFTNRFGILSASWKLKHCMTAILMG